MDTTRPSSSRIITLALTVAACVAFGPSARPEVEEARVVVVGATAAQEDTVAWAIDRFEVAGLEGLPSLEIRFFPTRDGCEGDIGRYKDGLVRLCVTGAGDAYVKKFLLHEMAHAWTQENIDPVMQERFLEQRGLAVWNGVSAVWKERGIEQSAEVIAWGAGEGEVAPLLPLPIDAQGLLEAYELLTGLAPINPVVVGA